MAAYFCSVYSGNGEERILSQVLRLLGVADHAQQIAVDPAIVAREHLIKGEGRLLRPRQSHACVLVYPSPTGPFHDDRHLSPWFFAPDRRSPAASSTYQSYTLQHACTTVQGNWI